VKIVDLDEVCRRTPPIVREQLVRALVQEATLAGKLHHNHIVNMFTVSGCVSVHTHAFQCCRIENVLCIHMEYLTGGTLLDHMHKPINEFGMRPMDKVILLMRQLVEAVNYLHTSAHLVHRDIKPDNVMFDKYGRHATPACEHARIHR
jgi:serine/threonine protein kinase